MILSETNYVDKAEKVIQKLAKNTDKRGSIKMVTTSQLRNLLAMTSDIYNEVLILQDEQLSEEVIGRINYLKVRFLYASKDELVKKFIEEANVVAAIDEIQGSRRRYIIFSRYMESLIAYHKFYGGKD